MMIGWIAGWSGAASFAAGGESAGASSACGSDQDCGAGAAATGCSAASTLGPSSASVSRAASSGARSASASRARSASGSGSPSGRGRKGRWLGGNGLGGRRRKFRLLFRALDHVEDVVTLAAEGVGGRRAKIDGRQLRLVFARFGDGRNVSSSSPPPSSAASPATAAPAALLVLSIGGYPAPPAGSRPPPGSSASVSSSSRPLGSRSTLRPRASRGLARFGGFGQCFGLFPPPPAPPPPPPLAGGARVPRRASPASQSLARPPAPRPPPQPRPGLVSVSVSVRAGASGRVGAARWEPQQRRSRPRTCGRTRSMRNCGGISESSPGNDHAHAVARLDLAQPLALVIEDVQRHRRSPRTRRSRRRGAWRPPPRCARSTWMRGALGASAHGRCRRNAGR